jgi:hypothetical protein
MRKGGKKEGKEGEDWVMNETWIMARHKGVVDEEGAGTSDTSVKV